MFLNSPCTTVACLPPIRGLEKCRVIGHNPHFSNLCSLSCLNPKVLPKGILFSACDWWKAVNCGTNSIYSLRLHRTVSRKAGCVQRQINPDSHHEPCAGSMNYSPGDLGTSAFQSAENSNNPLVSTNHLSERKIGQNT